MQRRMKVVKQFTYFLTDPKIAYTKNISIVLLKHEFSYLQTVRLFCSFKQFPLFQFLPINAKKHLYFECARNVVASSQN